MKKLALKGEENGHELSTMEEEKSNGLPSLSLSRWK